VHIGMCEYGALVVLHPFTSCISVVLCKGFGMKNVLMNQAFQGPEWEKKHCGGYCESVEADCRGWWR